MDLQQLFSLLTAKLDFSRACIGFRAAKTIKIIKTDNFKFKSIDSDIEYYGETQQIVLSAQELRKARIQMASVLLFQIVSNKSEIDIMMDLAGPSLNVSLTTSSSEILTAHEKMVLKFSETNLADLINCLKWRAGSGTWPVLMSIRNLGSGAPELEIGRSWETLAQISHTPDIVMDDQNEMQWIHFSMNCMTRLFGIAHNNDLAVQIQTEAETNLCKMIVVQRPPVIQQMFAPPATPKAAVAPSPVHSPPGINQNQWTNSVDMDLTDTASSDDTSASLDSPRSSSSTIKRQDLYDHVASTIISTNTKRLNMLKPESSRLQIAGMSPKEMRRIIIERNIYGKEQLNAFLETKYMDRFLMEIIRVHGVSPLSEKGKNPPSVEDLLLTVGAPSKSFKINLLALIFLVASVGKFHPDLFHSSLRTELNLIQERIKSIT